MEIGGVSLTKVGELGRFIRDQRRTARLSLRKMAQMAEISNPYLSQIERGLRRPSAEILQSIAKALRISAETLYVKAGILEERVEGSMDTMTALLRDHALSEKQKQVLIEIYQSFRTEDEAPFAEAPFPEDRAPTEPSRPKPKSAAVDASAKPKTAARKKTPTSAAGNKRAPSKRASS